MPILVCGSLAFDFIMVYPDQFRKHILPDQIHILNVTFLVPELRREFGGSGGTIAYNLKLLGEDPQLMATVGLDFDVYGSGPRGAGLDAVTDEHLGWGLMMVGAGTAYVVAAAWRFYRTLEPRVRRRTRIFIAARTTASSAAPTRSLARPGLMSRNAAATSTTRSQARASPTR